MTKKQKKMLLRILIAAVMLVALHFIPVTGWLRLALYLAAYIVIGYDIMKKAGQGILNGRVFDENFLMAVATIGAFALAIYEKSGDYNEAIAVMLFYQIGELFQSYAVGKSRKNISALTTPISSRTAGWCRSIPMRWLSARSSWCSPARRCPSTASSPRAPPP